MAIDPNGIALQSVDPDLATDDQNPAMQGGIDGLLDYAEAVNRWGEDIADAFGTNPAVARPGRSAPSGGIPAPYFHPAATRTTTPFVVAMVLTIVILLIVFAAPRAD